MNAKCKKKRLWCQSLSILFAVMILAGCSRGGADVPASGGQAEAVSQTYEATVENPTDTPAPTATPVPPTDTPAPTETPLPPTDTPVPTPTQPEARQGTIAFMMASQGGWGGIYVIQADGSRDPVMLSLHPGIDSLPSWSPDGSQIAFESFRDDPVALQHMDIYTINSDGSQLTRLTDTEGWYAQPDWSPDGSRIAMLSAESQESGDSDLSVLDLTTGELTRLTDGPGIDKEPSWSPDAAQITFTSYRDEAWNIYTLNLSTSETTQLTRESGNNGQPDWSPDGNRILFVSNRDGDEEIYVMDADGGNQARLTTTPGPDVNPEWSPDGNYFAYAHAGESGLRKIYVSDLNGSEPELLFENPKETTAAHPAWSMAEGIISEDPVFGPPVCMRDTDGDFEPDTPVAAFSTEDNFPFIAFPYDQMQDGMEFLYRSTEGAGYEQWERGEEGIHFISLLMLHPEPGVLIVELYLGEKFMQTIECKIVEP